MRRSPRSSAPPCRWRCRADRAVVPQRCRTMAKRILPDRCWGAVIDVQDFFLAQLGNRALRTRIETNLLNFARLLAYFRIPMIATLERPVFRKGRVPQRLKKLGEAAQVFEKDFFDLTKEKKIADHLSRLGRTQALVAGLRNRRVRSPVLPGPSRSRPRGLRRRGPAVLLRAQRRGGDRPHARRRRGRAHLQDPVLRADRGRRGRTVTRTS